MITERAVDFICSRIEDTLSLWAVRRLARAGVRVYG
jgi:hypothetical protein